MGYYTLDNIATEYKQILKIVEEAEGELTPELEEALAINRNLSVETIEKLYSIISILKSEQENIDFEIDRLKQKKNVRGSAIERIEESIANATKAYGVKNTTKSNNVTYAMELTNGRKVSAINYPKLEILSSEEVPEKYKSYSLVVGNMSRERADAVVDIMNNLTLGYPDLTVNEPQVKIDAASIKKDMKEEKVESTNYAKIAENYRPKFT